MASLPPLTSALVPVFIGLETYLAPVLGVYLPALDIIRQILQNIVPLLIGVHAFDSLHYAFLWFSGKKIGDFKPVSAMLAPYFNPPAFKAAHENPSFMNNIFNPGFTNSLSFASNVLDSIESSAKKFGE